MDYSKKIRDLILKESKRQENTISLIASENYVKKEILEAQGSILTNKYVEGYPKHRYYAGCEVVDEIELLGIELAKKVFGCDHANLQPHSGSQANEAAYAAILNPGDKILSMDLSAGGHLTHGLSINFSGRLYDFKHYGVSKETEMIDYKEVARIAEKFKPKLIIVGASSYSRIIDFEEFGKIATRNNCYLMADMAHISGLVAVGLHPSPVPYADIVTTTTHKTLRGSRGGMILCKKELAKKVDRAVFPGTQGGALVPAIAGKVIVLSEALTKEYKTYQKQVIENSKEFSKSFKTGRIISGGTDNHQFTIDVKSSYGWTGEEASSKLSELGIILNKNLIPFDSLGPRDTSGIRIGTPAGTTRGITNKEFFELGTKMESLFVNKSKHSEEQLKNYVHVLTSKHSLKNL